MAICHRIHVKLLHRECLEWLARLAAVANTWPQIPLPNPEAWYQYLETDTHNLGFGEYDPDKYSAGIPRKSKCPSWGILNRLGIVFQHCVANGCMWLEAGCQSLYGQSVCALIWLTTTTDPEQTAVSGQLDSCLSGTVHSMCKVWQWFLQ